MRLNKHHDSGDLVESAQPQGVLAVPFLVDFQEEEHGGYLGLIAACRIRMLLFSAGNVETFLGFWGLHDPKSHIFCN